jgi:hypothetical protein
VSTPAKRTAAKKATPAKKVAPVKKATPATPAKEAAPAKKGAPIKGTPAKARPATTPAKTPAKARPARTAPAKKGAAATARAQASSAPPRSRDTVTPKVVLAPLPPPPQARSGFSADERAEILHGLEVMAQEHPSAPRRTLDLLLAYVEGLPWLAVSRCPLTGAEMIYPIDTFGFDGPWWDYEHPARPDENVLPTVHAVTGAVAVTTPASSDWIVRPGPAVPFVVPHLLERADVTSVLSEVRIGADRGFLTVYYSQSHPPGPRFNTWGRDGYRIRAEGELVNMWEPELAESIDTDLGPWIDRGKLAWIAPGDRKLALQTTVAGCPYLAVTGKAEFASIRYGRIF